MAFWYRDTKGSNSLLPFFMSRPNAVTMYPLPFNIHVLYSYFLLDTPAGIQQVSTPGARHMAWRLAIKPETQ
jgi:hypothetical protein